MMNLAIKGTQNFMGVTIPVVYGGFGDNSKSITAKAISEIHNQRLSDINVLIKRLIEKVSQTTKEKRFRNGIEYIDLLSGSQPLTDLAKKLGMNISNRTQNAFVLSERGYSKLVKVMNDDTAWDVHDKLIDEYFSLREQNELVKKSPQNVPLDREELAAFMISNHQMIESMNQKNLMMLEHNKSFLQEMKSTNETFLQNQINCMTAMNDFVKSFLSEFCSTQIKNSEQCNYNIEKLSESLNNTLTVLSDGFSNLGKQNTETVSSKPVSEKLWKKSVFEKINPFSIKNKIIPQKALGIIYKMIKESGVDLDSYIDTYKKDYNLAIVSKIDAVAHYSELREVFDKKMNELILNGLSVSPTPGVYLSQVALKCPDPILHMITGMKPYYGNSTSAIMKNIYRRFEDEYNISLTDIADIHAMKIGVKKCSKSYAIYENKDLMDKLEKLITKMKKEACLCDIL